MSRGGLTVRQLESSSVLLSFYFQLLYMTPSPLGIEYPV